MFEVFKNSRQADGSLGRARSKKIAVVDTETTGVYSGRDRVIEVAIVLADWCGTVEEKFVTLINPNRDLGDTNIHGISAADVHDAPTFADVHGDIAERLRDRVVVGHNVSFDLRMLGSEYTRLTIDLPPVPSLCTMRLAYKLGPSSRKLKDCCLFYGVEPRNWHSALDDACATFDLLMRYVEKSETFGGFTQFEEGAYSHPPESAEWPSFKRSNRFKVRSVSGQQTINPFLRDLASRLPDPGAVDFAAYYLLLERAMEDRVLSAEEMSELSSIATKEGLGLSAIVEAHKQYLDDVVLVALQDGVITDREMKELVALTSILGLEQEVLQNRITFCSENAGAVAASSTDERNTIVGKTVCFTGTMTCKFENQLISRDLAKKLAQQHGLEISENVTKKTDILVIADPYSMSGKAKKARDFGTRILAEDVFWRMLGVAVT